MNILKSLSLKKRLINGFILCAILTAIAGGAGMYSLKQLEKNMQLSSGQIISTFGQQNLKVRQLMPLRQIISDIASANNIAKLAEIRKALTDLRAMSNASTGTDQEAIQAGVEKLLDQKTSFVETQNRLTADTANLQKNLEAITELAAKAQVMAKDSSEKEIETALAEIKVKFSGAMSGNDKTASNFKIDKAVTDVAMTTSLAISAVQAALFLQSECYQLNVLIKDALASPDKDLISIAEEKTAKLLPQMVTDLVELPENKTKTEINRLIQTLKGLTAGILESKKQMLTATENFAATDREIQAQMKKVDEALIITAADTTKGIQTSLSQNTDLVGRWQKIQIGIGGSALLLALGLGIALAGFIAKTVSRITNSLADSSTHVTDAAGQLSGSSDSLAEGASEQAASMEETTASLQEISDMTKKNASHANHAKEVMAANINTIKKLCADMTHLITTMQDIVASSEETKNIIKTIDAIAFQTNLLALNAAVEAARAGEAGAGFAVVASEVRNLAQRAAEAAKNTAQLIESSQVKIKDGAEMVSNTNQAILGMAAQAEDVQKLVAEISQASDDQAQSIGQILDATNEINTVTQRIAANAEESAGAAKEMNQQSTTLEGIVGELEQMIKGGQNKPTGR